MIIGRMKHKLTVLKPETVTDSFGSERTEWVEQNTIHAERVNVKGSRNNEAGELFPDYSVSFNVRMEQNISENWRVQEIKGFLYNVTNIVINDSKRFKTLICERVNP